MFNLFVSKHQRSYPYGRDMLRYRASRLSVHRNKYTFVGLAISAVVAGVVIYVPWISTTLLGTGPASWVAFGPPIAAGFILLGYEFARLFLRRKGTPHSSPALSQASLAAFQRSTVHIYLHWSA